MEPWQSWGLAVVLGGGVYWYYSTHDKDALARQAKAKLAKPVEAVVDAVPVAKRQKPSAPAKQKKRPSPSPLPLPQSQPQQSQQKQAEPEAEEKEDDLAWAQQLRANKEGVNLSKQSGSSQRVKTQSQRKAVEPVQASKDVSDMLEPAAPGPSVLRVTGEIKPAPKKQAPREEHVETKKQRQNRKKREAEKAQREADEQQRQALLEQQRRTAREARGEPAKNGLSASSPTNQWTTVSKQAAPHAQQRQQQQPLLDTFEHDNVSSASSVDAGNTATPATSNSIYDLPSEEQQLEMIKELDGWEQVSSKKPSKPKRDDSTAVQATPAVEQSAKKPAAPSAATVDRVVNSVRKGAQTNGFAALDNGHPQDSDWAV